MQLLRYFYKTILERQLLVATSTPFSLSVSLPLTWESRMSSIWKARSAFDIRRCFDPLTCPICWCRVSAAAGGYYGKQEPRPPRRLSWCIFMGNERRKQQVVVVVVTGDCCRQDQAHLYLPAPESAECVPLASRFTSQSAVHTKSSRKQNTTQRCGDVSVVTSSLYLDTCQLNITVKRTSSSRLLQAGSQVQLSYGLSPCCSC